MTHLGVNIDHVATLRQARGTNYPDPIEAARLAIVGGADQITIHLREDRRHIQDSDVERIKSEIDKPLNLEMAASDEIVAIACRLSPDTATLVPERREELTTEGGLDVAAQLFHLRDVVQRLTDAGISVSMFIDPEFSQIDASLSLGVHAVELHTGAFCDAKGDVDASRELNRLRIAAGYAKKSSLRLCAGHGLNYDNIHAVIRALPEVVEYNIGHSIIARAVFVGLEEAVSEMKRLLCPADYGDKNRSP